MLRRSTDKPRERVRDAFLKHSIGRQADRLQESFVFQILRDLRQDEGRVGTEVASALPIQLKRVNQFTLREQTGVG